MISTVRYSAYLLTLIILLLCPLLRADEPLAVSPGSPEKAKAYYARISHEVGFTAKPAETTLDELLDFAGYKVNATKLESLEPAVLMDPERLSSCDGGLCIPKRGLGGAMLRRGDILATRFFAPKIVNINVGTATPTLGWRKLVRLHVRPLSLAAQKSIESVIILFNYSSAVGQPPFAKPSFNTQVMLLAPKLPDRLYWLDFDDQNKLSLALKAGFDELDGAAHNYYVPDGCNACHGSPGNQQPALVNYLDTDHWFDRLENDFRALKEAGTPLIFDAETNVISDDRFTRAFDVIRQFNEEALQQNLLVQPPSFEAKAAETWLTIHANSDAPVPPIGRGFSMNGEPMWQVSETGGLALLNRYCFRCHGSVRFSVFDRASVVLRAGSMRQRLRPNKEMAKSRGYQMPPDRPLPPAELDVLFSFLKALR